MGVSMNALAADERLVYVSNQSQVSGLTKKCNRDEGDAAPPNQTKVSAYLPESQSPSDVECEYKSESESPSYTPVDLEEQSPMTQVLNQEQARK
jgi:hypothetical protein